MERKVEFKVGKDTLRGLLFIPKGKGPFPAVIFFHGSGGVGETHFENAKALSQHGILGFAFNYRGSGMSEGKFEDQTIGMGIEDARSAFNFLKSRKEVDVNRVGICGGSFGGFIAASLCNAFNVKSLLLEAPAAYNPEIVINTQRDSAKNLEKDFKDSISYREIEKYRGRLLIVSCELDDVLPPGIVEEYDKRAMTTIKKEKFVLKGAKHRISVNPMARRLFQEKLTDWFLETL